MLIPKCQGKFQRLMIEEDEEIKEKKSKWVIGDSDETPTVSKWINFRPYHIELWKGKPMHVIINRDNAPVLSKELMYFHMHHSSVTLIRDTLVYNGLR